jgi:Tfp pilus assembly protein PilW
MIATLKRLQAERKDEGLSLAEVLVAVGLTGLLAIGCTQLALASFSSASYTQAVAVKSIDSGNASRMITTDIDNAEGFLVPGKSGTAPAPAECSTATLASQPAGSVRALITLTYPNGNLVGYEVRTTAGTGDLWRVKCPSLSNPTGPAQLVRTDLPVATDPVWDTAVLCASYPTGGSLTTSQCVKDAMLTSLTLNPGVLFTIPAGTDTAGDDVVGSTSLGQTILAARDLG